MHLSRLRSIIPLFRQRIAGKKGRGVFVAAHPGRSRCHHQLCRCSYHQREYFLMANREWIRLACGNRECTCALHEGERFDEDRRQWVPSIFGDKQLFRKLIGYQS